MAFRVPLPLTITCWPGLQWSLLTTAVMTFQPALLGSVYLWYHPKRKTFPAYHFLEESSSQINGRFLCQLWGILPGSLYILRQVKFFFWNLNRQFIGCVRRTHKYLLNVQFYDSFLSNYGCIFHSKWVKFLTSLVIWGKSFIEMMHKSHP